MTLLEKIAEALQTLRPGAQWVLSGDNYADIEWRDTEQTKPEWDEVLAEINNPTPKTEPTVSEKLASVGLSLDDLKAALGL